MSEDAHKENAIPATSEAKSKGQSTTAAKKHDSKRLHIKARTNWLLIPVVQMGQSLHKFPFFKVIVIGKITANTSCKDLPFHYFNESKGLALYARNWFPQLGWFVDAKILFYVLYTLPYTYWGVLFQLGLPAQLTACRYYFSDFAVGV